MASRLLERLKRSLFKEGEGAEPQPAGNEQEVDGREEERWEAELAEEEECVSERLGGMLCFDGGGAGGGEEGGEEEGSGIDSDSDFLSESMEEGLSSTGKEMSVSLLLCLCVCLSLLSPLTMPSSTQRPVRWPCLG